MEEFQLMNAKRMTEGLPWWSNGYDSVLPLQGARVLSLVRELRSHMLVGAAKKKKKNDRIRKSWGIPWQSRTWRFHCQGPVPILQHLMK